jgi:uncharacterized protein (DUF1800 family)
MLRQHLTLRAHATGSFADLLHAMARDPAMLIYLDGITNTARDRNENFGRECLELFTMGRDGGYTQDDVVAAARSFTGWVVAIPGRAAYARLGAAPWAPVFVASRHDTAMKTLLGKTEAFDLDTALDVVLGHPATSRFVAAKLYRELVGLDPDDRTVARLAAGFAKDWSIRGLAEAIAADPHFTGDAAVRAKVRTPVEKLVAILQATASGPVKGVPLGPLAARARVGATAGVAQALRTTSYLPFLPPNVGGYAKGTRLLGPATLVHSFDLVQAATGTGRVGRVGELMDRLGLVDVSDRTRSALTAEHDPLRRLALAVGSPEFTVV